MTAYVLGHRSINTQLSNIPPISCSHDNLKQAVSNSMKVLIHSLRELDIFHVPRTNRETERKMGL